MGGGGAGAAFSSDSAHRLAPLQHLPPPLPGLWKSQSPFPQDSLLPLPARRLPGSQNRGIL